MRGRTSSRSTCAYSSSSHHVRRLPDLFGRAFLNCGPIIAVGRDLLIEVIRCSRGWHDDCARVDGFSIHVETCIPGPGIVHECAFGVTYRAPETKGVRHIDFLLWVVPGYAQHLMLARGVFLFVMREIEEIAQDPLAAGNIADFAGRGKEACFHLALSIPGGCGITKTLELRAWFAFLPCLLC